VVMKESLKSTNLGHLERGTGKHQSNIVYGINGLAPCITAGCGVKFWIYVIKRKKESH